MTVGLASRTTVKPALTTAHSLGDHLNTCTSHSGAKKTHDWMVDQIADRFRTTHKVKTQEVVKHRGQPCGDIELSGYLANARSVT
jgi:hypothetical protein